MGTFISAVKNLINSLTAKTSSTASTADMVQLHDANGNPNGKISLADLASVLGGIGERLISSGSDLNDITLAGDYYCNGGGGSLGHIPDANIAAFRMEVRSTNGSGRAANASSRRVYQILHPHNSAAGVYKRYFSGSSWTNWYTFNATQVVPT